MKKKDKIVLTANMLAGRTCNNCSFYYQIPLDVARICTKYRLKVPSDDICHMWEVKNE